MALLAMTLGIGGYRLSNGLHILRARSLLSGRRMELMKFSRALEDFDDKSVCIGYGFSWLPEHTQMLLMYLIDVEMRRGERSQPKLVIIDEAWDLMVRGHSSKFIEAGYRRARKLNGAFFTGTQGPGDYWKSSAAKAALDNADCKFIMKLKESVLSECEKESQLGLDDYEFQQLRSLKGLRDVYSEVLVKIGDAPTSVNRLILDPFSLLVMSTHPKDISDINRFRKEGLSMRKAIEAVLLERGQGDFIP